MTNISLNTYKKPLFTFKDTNGNLKCLDLLYVIELLWYRRYWVFQINLTPRVVYKKFE